MLQLFYRYLLFYIFLLPLCAIAQKKTELKAPAELSPVFTIFNNEVFGVYPFQLPHSGNLKLLNEQKVLFQANVKNYRLHGEWTSFYPHSQKLDEGILIKGVPNGEWKTWYNNGQIKSVRNYSADLFLKVKSDIDLNHPKISRFVLTDRYKKEGEKVLHVLSANYSFHITQPTIPVDVALLVTQNQQQPFNYHPPFKNVLHHGLYMNYFENGAIQDSGYYKEGLRSGLWEHHLANGTYWRGLYKNGIHVKDWKCFTREGKLLMFILYNEKGKEVYRKQF